MRGLKTNEGKKFEKFFELVQTEARKQNGVFFLSSDEGNNKETEEMEISDLSGWLIPDAQAKEFEKIWEKSSDSDELDSWSEKFFTFAFWTEINGEIAIKFKMF